MDNGIWELLASTVVGVIGQGAVSKWLARRGRRKAQEAVSLLAEVRAHGETKVKVAALEQRVVELETQAEARELRHTEDRDSWIRERHALASRIDILEALLIP